MRLFLKQTISRNERKDQVSLLSVAENDLQAFQSPEDDRPHTTRNDNASARLRVGVISVGILDSGELERFQIQQVDEINRFRMYI